MKDLELVWEHRQGFGDRWWSGASDGNAVVYGIFVTEDGAFKVDLGLSGDIIFRDATTLQMAKDQAQVHHLKANIQKFREALLAAGFIQHPKNPKGFIHPTNQTVYSTEIDTAESAVHWQLKALWEAFCQIERAKAEVAR